jgi:hypothetical protein
VRADHTTSWTAIHFATGSGQRGTVTAEHKLTRQSAAFAGGGQLTGPLQREAACPEASRIQARNAPPLMQSIGGVFRAAFTPGVVRTTAVRCVPEYQAAVQETDKASSRSIRVSPFGLTSDSGWISRRRSGSVPRTGRPAAAGQTTSPACSRSPATRCSRSQTETRRP